MLAVWMHAVLPAARSRSGSIAAAPARQLATGSTLLPLPSTPRPAAFGLTLVWALVAVFEHTGSPLVRRASLVAIVLLAVLSIASVLRRPGPQPQYEHPDVREPLRPHPDGP